MQSKAGITNWGKSYHKVGVGNLLQNGSIVIAKVREVLLSAASILQNVTGFAKGVTITIKGLFTFVILGQMETHVY